MTMHHLRGGYVSAAVAATTILISVRVPTPTDVATALSPVNGKLDCNAFSIGFSVWI